MGLAWGSVADSLVTVKMSQHMPGFLGEWRISNWVIVECSVYLFHPSNYVVFVHAQALCLKPSAPAAFKLGFLH